MKKLALIVVLLTTCVSFAKTWHVEQATGDDAAAAADSTGKTPFKSIRKALSNSNLRNGDTVLVGDGVYTWADGMTSNVNGRTVLNITAGITLKSVNGPATTHIVGKQSTETPEGLGVDAARCITVNVKKDVTDDVIIQGFTVRDGGTIDQKLTMGRGGAIYNAVTAKKNIFIVNCVISNCVSYSYVMNSPNLRGCRVEDCYSRDTVVGMDGGTAAFTLFSGMRNESGTTVTRAVKAVNCTFVANRGSYDFLESQSYVNHVYNSICSASGDVKLDKSATGPMDAQDSLIGTSDAYPLMAPYFGDYRVRAGSAAEGTGNADWLDEITLPTDWTFADFADPYGNPIDVNNLHLGAVQEAVTPTGGGLRLASGVTLEDGPALPHFSYVFPTNYPIQYKMGASLAAGKQLFGFSLSPVTTAPYRFPKWGENHIYTMPSPDPTKVTTNKIALVDETIWVSPGEPGTGDGTYENPYGTLNDAIDNASQSSASYLICAKGGVYNNGAKVLSDSAGANFGKAVVALNMRAKNVRLVAVDGPANTTIEGACDPETGECGANAVRCVLLYLKSGATEGFAAVQGFTLTGGYSLASTDGQYGAAVYGSGSDYCFVTDCRIYGNNGAYGACAGALFERCEIFDNRTTTSIVVSKKNTVLSSCLIHNNRGVTTYDGALGMNVTAVNCTVAERPTGHALGTGYALNAWNCVIAGGDSTGEKAVLDGCVLWDFDTYKSAIKGYRKLDPYWVNPHPDDRTTTDLRSFLISDVFTAGTLPTTENAGADLYQYVGADFSGKRMTFGETSMPAGAYVAGVPYVLIVADKGGVGTDGKVGFNVLEGDATLDVYSSGVADRPCVGVFVGDELKLFDDLEGGDGIPPETVRITAAEAVAGLTVTAAYTNEWYVKPDGSDASSGFTPKHAKKTFAAVMECAQAGDTVRCGEGDYGDEVGSMTEGGNVARVVVKDGVTLAGAGVDKTIIRGKADGNGTNGCGPDALRCVILAGSTAKVKDLTMVDGRSGLVGTGKDDYKNYVANFGGGVFVGKDNTGATVENCLITNCAAVRGGGSYYAKLVNCRVVGNRARFASNGAAALYYGSAYGTVFMNNVGSDYTVMYPTVLENCTIAGNSTTSKTGYDFFISASGTCTLRNTLIAGSSTLNNTTKACTISHCAFASDASSTIPADKTDGTCVYAPLADFTFDAEGRPIVGANPAIDKGDLTQFRESICGAFDASGFQRVMNGTMDIGALEADWRGRYRKDLKVRLGEVRAATPGIVENAQGKVVLSDGDALDLSWSHRCAGTSQLNVTITGEGALTIRKGDETLATVTETTSIDYPVSPDVTDELTFAFAGTGSASFDVTDAHLGILLMIR